MKLIRLQAFKEVINAGTVTEASRRLKCSQPRISRLISELEEEIGFPLFRREKQRLEPTTEGQLFYKETERILLGIDDIDRIANDIHKQRETCLRLLSQPHLAHGLLGHVFEEFENQVKGVRYYLKIPPREELAKWLGGHQFDLALAPLPVKHPLVRHEQLVSVKLLVAVPKINPLSDKKQITIKNLLNEPIIALAKGTIMRQRLDDIFHQVGAVPNIRIETPTVLSACQFVLRGLGVTLADPFSASLFCGGNYILRPFSPDYKITYGALFLRQNPPRHIVRQFIETVKVVANDIAHKLDAPLLSHFGNSNSQASVTYSIDSGLSFQMIDY